MQKDMRVDLMKQLSLGKIVLLDCKFEHKMKIDILSRKLFSSVHVHTFTVEKWLTAMIVVS